MATKQTYIVNRAMHGDGKDYARGDEREMSEADAATLVESGALARKGSKPAERDPAVRHTFGQEPSEINEAGYTSASGDGVIVSPSNAAPKKKADAKPADKAAS